MARTPSGDRELRLEPTPELLLGAYAAGVFPMAESRHEPELAWVDPDRRGILPLERFHTPRSLARSLRRRRFRVTVDTAFDAVVRGCAAPAPGRENTWINDTLTDLYGQLHARGHAHSLECWHGDRLAGGLYGVTLGAAFFGESMFSGVRDASKVGLAHLVERLRRGGYRLFDIQFLTAHLARFGAIEVSRATYRRLLAAAVAGQADFYSLDAVPDGASAQSSTQIS